MAAAEVGTTSPAQTVLDAGRPDRGAAGARLVELFAAHGSTVFGLCRMLLRQREEAEDAFQQTFLAAYRSLLGGVEPRHPAAWLAAIARNECCARARQRMRELPAQPDADRAHLDPAAAAAAKADLAELWDAIDDLPAQQRDALLLRELGGLSYAQLAQALAVSEPAVESLLVRARRRLRLRLRSTSSASVLAPLGGIREALARAIGGMPDPATTGALTKMAAAPLLTKLAAGAAVLAAAGGTIAGLEHGSKPVRRAVSAPATSGPLRAVLVRRSTPVAQVRHERRVRPATRLRPAPQAARRITVRSTAPAAAPSAERPVPRSTPEPKPQPVAAEAQAPDPATSAGPAEPALPAQSVITNTVQATTDSAATVTDAESSDPSQDAASETVGDDGSGSGDAESVGSDSSGSGDTQDGSAETSSGSGDGGGESSGSDSGSGSGDSGDSGHGSGGGSDPGDGSG